MNQEKTKIFLIECSAPHWLSVVKNLQQNNIHVCYWTGWSRLKPDVLNHSEDVVFHDTLYAKSGCDPENKPYQLEKLDNVCLDIWASEAQIVYDMMNRFDHSRDQTFVERSLLFSEHLSYWRKVLDQQKPDLVVFSTPPHVVYDYILLALCRALKINTIMYEEATIYPPYCLSMNDYISGSSSLTHEAQKTHAISQQTREIVAKLRGDYAKAKPIREVIAHEAMDQAIAAGLKGLEHRTQSVKRIDKEHSGLYEKNEKIVNTGSLYKQRGKNLRRSFAGAYANSQFMDQLIEQFHCTNELRTFYNNHVTPLELIDAPFVYVALAGQPERTSNPQAGIFTNQLLMLNLIAHALPDGWVLAVREHPNQFHPEFAVNMCRSVEYYQSMISIPKIHLISTKCDPFDVIDRSRIVATSGGTTALEGVARGKPALLFGDAWYRDCPGVFRIRKPSDMADFFENYGTIKISEDKFANYLEAITKGCFAGLADYPPADYPVEEHVNVNNLTRTVLQACEV